MFLKKQVRDAFPLGRVSKNNKIQSNYFQIHFESKLPQINSSILIKYFFYIL